jgi:hypothetical protein
MILTYRKCLSCGIRYLQADFLAYRQKGYCTKECSYYERRGVPTAECIGWKNGIPASTQRKTTYAPQTNDAPPRQWIFDIVRASHHLRPISGA